MMCEIVAFIEFPGWMKDIISHPNTPAYIQAAAVIIATCAGLNYFKKRTTEKKFDLVVEAYKCCLEACDVLSRLKQPPIVFKNRDDVEFYEDNNNKLFADMVSHFAEGYLRSLNEEHELFERLYNCYAEMRLFFNKDKQKLKPLENLLFAMHKIKQILEMLTYNNKQLEHLNDNGKERIIKAIRGGMVQIWENIELADWQKEIEKRKEEIDGIPRVRRFYYLNDLIEKTRKDIDNLFPEMINN